jgi:hypothetical protein
MWSSKPWDNDRAADWFANLMQVTHFPDQVRRTLVLCEEEDACGENTVLLRAAVHCALQFCRVYVWPIQHLDDDLELAIKAARKILTDEDYCASEGIVAQVQAELEELELRRKA